MRPHLLILLLANVAPDAVDAQIRVGRLDQVTIAKSAELVPAATGTPQRRSHPKMTDRSSILGALPGAAGGPRRPGQLSFGANPNHRFNSSRREPVLVFVDLDGDGVIEFVDSMSSYRTVACEVRPRMPLRESKLVLRGDAILLSHSGCIV